MRNNKGSLIAVWSPCNHGAGVSTLTNSVGIALQHLTDKKTLIVNMGSQKNYLEQYLKNDIALNYSLDYLKSFNKDLRSEHIKMYASSINEHLHILPSCKIAKNSIRSEEDFIKKFLEEALKAFDIVILDLDSGLDQSSKWLLESADVIVTVMKENDVILDDVSAMGISMECMKSSKAISVFNCLHHGGNQLKALKRLNKKLRLDSSFGISFDIEAYKAACLLGRYYSYLKNELNKKRSESPLAEQVRELSSAIAEMLYLPIESMQDHLGLISMIFPKRKQWGEVDA